MSQQTKIGGVNRKTLLGFWLLFFAWSCVSGLFAPYQPQPWLWFAWAMGSALTSYLLYRRSDLAGIVGYVVAATAAAMTLPQAFSVFRSALSGGFHTVPSFRFVDYVLYVSYQTAKTLVPTVVLILHVASRHRLQRSFEESVALRRHGRIVRPGAYYFVTRR